LRDRVPASADRQICVRSWHRSRIATREPSIEVDKDGAPLVLDPLLGALERASATYFDRVAVELRNRLHHEPKATRATLVAPEHGQGGGAQHLSCEIAHDDRCTVFDVRETPRSSTGFTFDPIPVGVKQAHDPKDPVAVPSLLGITSRDCSNRARDRQSRSAIETERTERQIYGELLEGGRLNSKSRKLSAESVRNAHAVLRRALNDAVRWGAVSRNVALLADPPRARQDGHEMRTWSADELRAFLDHISKDRLSALWTLPATTGMRRGEAVGLRWSDIDLESARAQVRQTRVVTEGKVVVSEPKTARGRRSVALDSTTVAALKEHRRRQLEDRLAAGSAWQDAGLVFTREDGTLIAPDSLTQAFERHVRNAKLPTIRLHDLRHTHASLALAAGIPAKVVSERLGHSSIVITLDLYSHVSPALEEDAAERVAALVFGHAPA